MKYFETSAMTGDGIAEMMDNIMNQVYDYKIVPEKLQQEQNPQAVSENREGIVTLNKPRQSMNPNGQETPAAGGGCC